MKNKIFVRKSIAFLIFILIMFTPKLCFAVPQSENTYNTNVLKYSNTYFDKLVKSGQIPGATLVIVKDGKVILKKGYGYANVEKKIIVDPDKTIFRAGSVSKLVTGTAIMQLKEKNKLDINTDINKYLKDMEITNKYKKPITIANLMTHTAGFDESNYQGGSGYDADMNTRFVNSVTKYVPQIVRTPSTVPSYSNYGVALEGYIISLVSGESFTNYIDKNIFKPLNMKNSTFNMGKDTINNMANGYYLLGGKYNKIDIYGEPQLPAGGLNAPAADMGNFILAHLQNGKFENNQILSENSINEMHSEQFKSGKFVGGICYAFMEDYVNGHRVIEHTGSVPGFTSHLVLIPESNTGYFLSINEDSNANDIFPILTGFEKGLVNTILPSSLNKDLPLYPISQKELDNYVGIYKGTRTTHKTLFKVGDLISNSFELTVRSNNNKLIVSDGKVENSFVCVAPNEFRNEKDKNYISFLPDASNKINYMMVSRVNSMEKIKWYEQSKIHLILLSTLLLIFLLQIIISGKTMVANFRKKIKNNRITILALSISVISISFIIGLVLYFLTLPPDFLMEEFGTQLIVNSIFVKLWLTFPFVSIALTLLLILLLMKRRKSFGTLQKIGYLFFTLISSSYILFLNYWCLLGYKLY